MENLASRSGQTERLVEQTSPSYWNVAGGEVVWVKGRRTITNFVRSPPWNTCPSGNSSARTIISASSRRGSTSLCTQQSSNLQ